MATIYIQAQSKLRSIFDYLEAQFFALPVTDDRSINLLSLLDALNIIDDAQQRVADEADNG